MEKTQENQSLNNYITNLSLTELRTEWAKYWNIEPHENVGIGMLQKSLEYKMREARGDGLTLEQQKRLTQLVSAYKRNPKFFKEGMSDLKPGIRLVKQYKGEQHTVIVRDDCYEYRDKVYGSLSEIAFAITGTRWNGWLFFGLKKRSTSK